MMYTPVRISTIRPDGALSFDLYILFKDQYVKYTPKGEMIKNEVHSKLKKQKVAKFFITEEDEVNYQQFLDAVLLETIENPDIAIGEKINVVDDHASHNLTQAYKDPSNPEGFKKTESAAKNLHSLITQNKEAFKEMLTREVHDNELLIHHCLNVSTYATKLAILHECKEEDQVILSLVGLLHDIGHGQLEENHRHLFLKNKSEMSEEEKKSYDLHPEKGVELLSKNPLITKEITDLISIHEDNLEKKGKLTLMEEILSLTNNFDKLVTFRKMSFKEALSLMSRESLGCYNMELFNKFKQLLKLEKLL